MATQEISSSKWQAFAQKFNDLHQGSLMTVESIDASDHREVVASESPLREFSFGPSNACSDAITLRLGGEGRREQLHQIIEPIHLKVRPGQNGGKVLQIDGESGSTLVTFHSGKIFELIASL